MMNLHESAIKMRQIASDIFDVSESISGGKGEIVHGDALDTTAIIVRAVLTALAADNPAMGMIDYRNAFVEILDRVILKMEVRASNESAQKQIDEMKEADNHSYDNIEITDHEVIE